MRPSGHLQYGDGRCDGFASSVVIDALPWDAVDYPEAGTLFDALTDHGISLGQDEPRVSPG